MGMFRWPGSKERVKEQIVEKIGAGKRKRWISPFCGACHVEFEAVRLGLAGEYVLAHALPDLVDALNYIQMGLADVFCSLKRIFLQDKESYYILRGVQPTTRTQRAERFLLLQSMAWNGLWRV